MAVVCRDARPSEDARQVRQALLESDLDALHVRTAGVDRLTHEHRASRGNVGKRLGGVILRGDDWVGQIFLEVSRLQKPSVPEAALVKQVVIIGLFGLQVWVAKADVDDALVLRGLAHRCRKVLRIGPRNPASVYEAEVGVFVQRETERRAG